MPSRMGNKLSSSCIIHGEEEGLPRGLPRITFIPLLLTLHMNAAGVSVPDRSCRSGAVNHACLRGRTSVGYKALPEGVVCQRRRASNSICSCLPRRMGDAEEVDISAVGNLLLHGDARDTASSRYVGVSDARYVLANARWKTNLTEVKRCFASDEFRVFPQCDRSPEAVR